MTMRTIRGVALGIMASIAAGGRAHAQSLGDRVGATRDGAVTFQFAARDGICGDGSSFIRYGRSVIGNYSEATRSMPCVTGPVQVRLTLHDGAVERVESWVGPARAHEGTSLGTVSAVEGATYLVGVSEHATGRASSSAILPAVLADTAVIWPALIRLAHDSVTASRAARQEATMWLSRYAAGAVAGRRNDPLSHDEGVDDQEALKDQAVFVLSQMHDRSGVPALLEVARTNKDAHVRGSALFWLGQSGDPRALSLFESLLR